MLHPATTIKPVSKNIGLGIFATDFIPMGTIVYVKDPLEIVIHNHDSRLLDDVSRYIIERYSYREPNGVRILSWDLAKYVNHSCDPNTISTGYGFEIVIRDINPGEQVTDDYGLLNIEQPMRCRCRSACCRKTIRPDDLDTHTNRWDDVIKHAMTNIKAVGQPLYPVLEPVTIKALENYFVDYTRYQSVSNLAYKLHDQCPDAPTINTASVLNQASSL